MLKAVRGGEVHLFPFTLARAANLKLNIMKVLSFLSSLVLTVCALVMLIAAAMKDSPMYFTGLIILSIMFGLSVIMTAITYKELKEF